MPGDLGPDKALLQPGEGYFLQGYQHWEGHTESHGRAGVLGVTGCFRGQAEARTLASDSLSWGGDTSS